MLKNAIGEIGGVKRSINDVRSRPLSIVQVFELEKEHVDPGFESESSRQIFESMRWLGFRSWGEMLEY